MSFILFYYFPESYGRLKPSNEKFKSVESICWTKTRHKIYSRRFQNLSTTYLVISVGVLLNNKNIYKLYIYDTSNESIAWKCIFKGLERFKGLVGYRARLKTPIKHFKLITLFTLKYYLFNNNHRNIEINVTHDRHFSLVYLLGITRPTTTR